MDDERYEKAQEFKKKERELEKERLKSELQDIKDILEGRDKIHRSVKKELDKKIEKEDNRLSHASKSDEPGIRENLKELYRERREELVGDWRDRQSWWERKLELERKLDEIEAVEELDPEG